MNKRIYLYLFILMFTLTAVACGNQAEDNDAEEASSLSAEAESETADPAEADDKNNVDVSASDDKQNSNDEASDDSDTDSSSSSDDPDKELPDTIEINDRIQTDTGLIFELEKISFEDDHIAVHFNAENLSGFNKTLASQGAAKDTNLGGITLQDDKGFDYRYVADTGDARVEIKDQEKVDAIARFVGRIQNDAETLTLKFNPEENESNNLPKFSYEEIDIEW